MFEEFEYNTALGTLKEAFVKLETVYHEMVVDHVENFESGSPRRTREARRTHVHLSLLATVVDTCSTLACVSDMISDGKSTAISYYKYQYHNINILC